MADYSESETHDDYLAREADAAPRRWEVPMLTPEQCAEIKARWAAATPGPWWYDGHMYVWRGGPHAVAGMVADSECRDLPGGAVVRIRGAGARLPMDENATAIASAPTDVAALLATVEALRSELAEAVRVLSELEWVRRDWGGSWGFECPCCGANEYNSKGKHEDGCELSAFLARHGGA